MTDLDDRIRHAYGPVPTDDPVRERLWTRALEPGGGERPRPRRWRAPRTLFAAVAVAVSIGSIAVAQPGPIGRMIGGERHADRLSVLQEPDPIGTKGLSDTAEGMMDGSNRTGFSSVDPDKLHHVLDYDGAGYVVRLRSGASADGQACLYQETLRAADEFVIMGAGSCSRSMHYNGHVTVGYGSDFRLGTLVTGLASDEVEQVRVKLSSKQVRAAQMGRNGYLLHLPNPKVNPRGLLVDLKDGRTIEVAMNGCLPSQLAAGRSGLGCGFGMNKLPPEPVR